jgi:hypothetical protein
MVSWSTVPSSVIATSLIVDLKADKAINICNSYSKHYDLIYVLTQDDSNISSFQSPGAFAWCIQIFILEHDGAFVISNP